MSEDQPVSSSAIPPLSPAASRRQWFTVLMLTFCGYLAGFNVGKVSAALPDIRADLDLSLLLAGSIASSYSMVAMLFAILLGILVSRYGAVACVFAGLFVTGVAAAFGATATGYQQLLLSRVAEGVGYILLAIAMPVLIARVINEKSRPVAMGIWGTFIPGGVALSMFVALFFQNQWRSLWWFTCLFVLLCLVLMQVFVLPVLRDINTDIKSASAKVKPPLYSSVLALDPLLLAASFTLYSMFFITLVTYLPTVLTESSTIRVETATTVSAFVALFNILGNLTGGWLIGHGVRLKALLTLALVGAGVFSSVVFLDQASLAIRITCALLACFFGGILPASVFASVTSFVSVKKAGLLLGILFQALGCGQVVGPLLMAALVETLGGWRWGTLYFLCLALAGVLLMTQFQRNR